MTVSTTTTKNSLSANGTLHSFAYGFKIFANADISVIVRSTTGTETVKTLDTHYVVTNAGNSSGGNVLFKFNTGTSSDAHFSSTDHRPANNETVVLARALTRTQGTDYVANDPFPAASHEDALDRLTMITQQIQEEVDRSIKASVTNTLTGAEFTISATDRANKVFAFDSSGNLSVTQELGTNRGNWAASTAYAQRDIVKDTGTANIFIVNTAHTSSGAQPLPDNANAAKYDIIVDAASATTSKTAAASSATAAANSATAAASSATTSGNSATTSGNSATASANSATTSGNSATASGNSNTASGNSATASASSATAAASSATAAANSAAQVGALDGVTAGTVAGSKAVVVDANKDVSSFRNLTATGAVTAGSLVIGSADIAESELEMIDGITAGTAAASKAMVLDSSADITGGRNLTISGEIDAATGDFSGIVDVAGALTVSNTTASSSSTTGSLIVGGGVGIAADLFVGDDFDVTGDAVIDGTALVTGVLTTTAATVFNGGFVSNANSGIGLAASSGVRLEVKTGDNAGHLVARFENNHASGSFGISVKAGDDSGNYAADFANKSGTTLMRIRGDGRVGIGTNAPDAGLQIQGADGSREATMMVTAAGVASAGLACDAGGLALGVETSKGFKFKTAATAADPTDTGTIIMEIASTGAVTKPLNVFFYARPAAAVNGSTVDPYTFGTVVTNTGGGFVTTSGATGRFSRFVAPVAGRYLFSSTPAYGETGQNYGARFVVNGGVFAETSRYINSDSAALVSHFSFNNSIILQIAASDYVEIVGIGETYHQNATLNYFSGYLLG